MCLRILLEYSIRPIYKSVERLDLEALKRELMADDELERGGAEHPDPAADEELDFDEEDFEQSVD